MITAPRFLALTMVLAACTSPEDPEDPVDPANTHVEFRIVDGDLSSEDNLDEMRLPAGDGTSMLDDESLDDGGGDGGGGCWVTLQWCKSPQTGWPMCTATPSCTYTQIANACISLVLRTC